MSNKLNKSLSAISSKSFVEWIGILSLLICKSLDMELNSFAYTDNQSEIKINDLLSDPFTLTQGVRQGCPLSMVLYITVAYVFANFINADKRIEGIQIGDHEIKLVNFADEITFFLADITCLNRIHMI